MAPTALVAPTSALVTSTATLMTSTATAALVFIIIILGWISQRLAILPQFLLESLLLLGVTGIAVGFLIFLPFLMHILVTTAAAATTTMLALVLTAAAAFVFSSALVVSVFRLGKRLAPIRTINGELAHRHVFGESFFLLV